MKSKVIPLSKDPLPTGFVAIDFFFRNINRNSGAFFAQLKFNFVEVLENSCGDFIIFIGIDHDEKFISPYCLEISLRILKGKLKKIPWQWPNLSGCRSTCSPLTRW